MDKRENRFKQSVKRTAESVKVTSSKIKTNVKATSVKIKDNAQKTFTTIKTKAQKISARITKKNVAATFALFLTAIFGVYVLLKTVFYSTNVIENPNLTNSYKAENEIVSITKRDHSDYYAFGYEGANINFDGDECNERETKITSAACANIIKTEEHEGKIYLLTEKMEMNEGYTTYRQPFLYIFDDIENVSGVRKFIPLTGEQNVIVSDFIIEDGLMYFTVVEYSNYHYGRYVSYVRVYDLEGNHIRNSALKTRSYYGALQRIIKTETGYILTAVTYGVVPKSFMIKVDEEFNVKKMIELDYHIGQIYYTNGKIELYASENIFGGSIQELPEDVKNNAISDYYVSLNDLLNNPYKNVISSKGFRTFNASTLEQTHYSPVSSITCASSMGGRFYHGTEVPVEGKYVQLMRRCSLENGTKIEYVEKYGFVVFRENSLMYSSKLDAVLDLRAAGDDGSGGLNHGPSYEYFGLVDGHPMFIAKAGNNTAAIIMDINTRKMIGFVDAPELFDKGRVKEYQVFGDKKYEIGTRRSSAYSERMFKRGDKVYRMNSFFVEIY